jgi:predicted PurR-regulated permease PerM
MENGEEESPKGLGDSKVPVFLLGFVCFILAVAALKLTTPVVIPLTIALLFTFVLDPLISLLEKVKIPRVLGSIFVVLLAGFAIYLVGLILFGGMRSILGQYPKYEQRFTEIYTKAAEFLGLPYDEQLSLFQNIWGQNGLRLKVQSYALGFSESFLSFLKDAVIVILIVVFLLIELGHFRKRVEVAFAGRISRRIQIIIAGIITEVSRYLAVKFIISLLTGVLAAASLSIIGLDFAILWGIIAFIMNFIPNLGSIVSWGGTTLFALVQFWPYPGPILATGIVMLAINFILGNAVEPKIQGDNLGLSPFVIVASLVGWGWLWGFAGLVLAVPMTVIIKIVCENVPMLEPVSILLGSYKEVKIKSKIEGSVTNLVKTEKDVQQGK